MKTYASFYDIVQGVKEETGITNLVNRYNEINSLIVRAERDINPYAGHFIRKKLRFKKGSGAFNGKSIKVPDDFIEIIGVYDQIEEGRSPFEIKFTNTSHILLCNGLINNQAVLSYWASQTDPEGHPFVPYGHYEAVVAFIVWKIYSQRFFLNDGNANAKFYYQDNYERFARAAKGSDFFPSEESLRRMRADSHTPSMFAVVCDDDCFCACSLEEDDTPPIEEDMNIWYWQENSLQQIITQDDVTDLFLQDKQKITKNAFKSGTYFTSQYIGRYGLAIQNGPTTPTGIIDALGSSIENSVNWTYYPDRKMLVLISKNYITPGTFFLKLTQ